MGKATKGVKGARATRKSCPFPLSKEARGILRRGAECEREWNALRAFGDPDEANWTRAEERRRNIHMKRRDRMMRDLGARCDAIAERFDTNPKSATMTDVMTLTVASLYSGRARGNVAPALLRVAGIWPM